MHNNKKDDKSNLKVDGMIYIRKEDIDNGITYGAFNNMNENEEYTKDKPKPKKGSYYLIQCVGIEKFY
ncbi:hypothetical protein [uncultured Mediterranean phage uvMED]|nr:hypothetical protein [uncultured Mediterranean phage uvMED]